MASLVYTFAFGPSCAGLDAVVTDAYTGDELDDSPITLDSSGSGSVTVAQGSYSALVSSADRGNTGDMVVSGALDIAASIEAAALLPETP